MSPILTVPHATLREVAKPILTVDKKILRLISDMTATLLAAKNPKGVGLAAPQIGIPLRLFLIRPNPKKPPQLFINPEIIIYSQAKQSPKSRHGVYEGCLSIPNHYAPVTRAMAVTVKYQTLKTSPLTPLLNSGEGNKRGEVVEKTAVYSGFSAHIIQHETDHLNGLLFIDRVLEQGTPLYRLEGKTWHEVTI